MSPDVINALFNVCGAIAISSSVCRLYRDKVVRGVHWGMMTFFISWSTWNIYFYAYLFQWYSFFAGMLMVLTEGTYLYLLLYYTWRERGLDKVD